LSNRGFIVPFRKPREFCLRFYISHVNEQRVTRSGIA